MRTQVAGRGKLPMRVGLPDRGHEEPAQGLLAGGRCRYQNARAA
jgi:hypothetical protein